MRNHQIEVLTIEVRRDTHLDNRFVTGNHRCPKFTMGLIIGGVIGAFVVTICASGRTYQMECGPFGQPIATKTDIEVGRSGGTEFEPPNLATIVCHLPNAVLLWRQMNGIGAGKADGSRSIIFGEILGQQLLNINCW